ncbi:hypothetical protein PRIC1_006325 [Phytophthora ramorum]
MERGYRVSAVEEDLELAERSPEPSPRPSPMLPPFRQPRRPVAPPPPPPAVATAAPARRSIGGSLPRRSLLAPEEVRPSDNEYARGRDSDERKSEQEPESEKPRGRRPRKKRRSRILSELRPVEGPESALPSVPPIDDDDDSHDADDPLEATDSGARAKEAFAAQRVRMRKAWCPDLRIYMKNAHPLFGICAAHRHHPYKRGDRFLVLCVALLVAVLLCGLFAIRDCCTEVLDEPVAVVNRRLETTARELSTAAYFDESDAPPSRLRGGRRAVALAATYRLGETEADDVKCLPFYADCSAVSSVCADGSACRSGTDNAVAQCDPDEVPQKCVAGSCPIGWTCNASTNSCTPASNYVCYLPAAETAVDFAADSDGTFTAIEAIFQILQIAANKHAAEMQSNNSSSQDGTAQQSQSATPSPRTPSPPTTSTPPTSSSLSSGSASISTASSSHSSEPSSSAASSSSSQEVDTSSSSSASNATSESASGSVSSESSTVKVTLTEPVNGAVYSLSSTMLIEWHLTLISGIDPGLQNFRVDFSADNGIFDTIAANVSSSSSSGSSDDSSVFQFEWELADNISWLCTTCVLRICALDVESATDESLCIRSDGQAASDGSSRRLQTTTVEGSSNSDITFRIVREAFECSCGMGHASFILAAVIIGACIPVLLLLAEPLVTFYRDRQVFGLFARRDGPVRPVIAGYDATSATRKGRAVLVVVLLALCVACGFVAAQITTTNFLTEKGAIVVLWVVTFAIAAVLGVLVYCTLVGFVIFSFRWWRERAHDHREPSGLSAYRSSLLSSDVNANNESIMSPP